MPQYECSGPVDVDVDSPVGYTEVVATDRPEVLAEVTPTVAGRAGDIALAESAEVSFTDGRLRIRVPRRLNLFGQSDSVDVRIEVPPNSRVRVGTSYGSVRTLGELGDTHINAKHGTVRLETVGDLTLDSRHGSVEVSRVTGRADVTAGHGNVRIEHIAGDAVVRSSHGDLQFGTTTGTVEVSTSGSMTIDRSSGDVRARSAHGVLRVREAAGGSVDLENGYADVEVGVPAGVAAWIDAAAEHGAVRNELTPDPDAATSDRAVRLHLRSNWANVVVRRTGPSAGVRR